jgi:acetyltransferase-like isoleucine patch superfamily enzyme
MNLFRKVYVKILTIIRHDLEKNPNTSNVISVSKDSVIHSSVRLVNSRISGHVEINQGCKIINGVDLKGFSKIKIGKYTSVNGPSTDIMAAVHPVEIGSFCSIARGVNIQEYNHKFDELSSYFFHQNLFGDKMQKDITSSGKIVIGNDVWIGAQCVILSGAEIGHGAVIAANSVVIGEIPPYAIAAGSPAKVIKYRFSPDKISRLLELKWWDKPLDEIKNLLKNNI